MSALTKDTLDKLNKQEIIAITLSLQKKLEDSNDSSYKFHKEIQSLNDNFSKINAELNESKKKNAMLEKRLEDIERVSWATAQYSRKECIEIVGLPTDIGDKNLEDIVTDLTSKIGCEVSKENIEACHFTGKKQNVIVKLSRRKDCQRILESKQKLKDVTLNDLDLPGNSTIYINQSFQNGQLMKKTKLYKKLKYVQNSQNKKS